MNHSASPSTWHPLLRYLAPLALLLLIGLAAYAYHRTRLENALMRTEETQLQGTPELLAYASQRAEPLYQQHCASCHGADLRGDHAKGAPNLDDVNWLYGSGELAEIENLIMYGIRSGHPKSRNLTDMPNFGRSGLLNVMQIQDVVEYVLQISKQPHDAQAAQRGREIFQSSGNCYDCHASDGYGEPNYGAPNLVGRGDAWLYGGDRAALYKSVFDGRHGLCPAWINTLPMTDIRALAAFLYSRSHPQAGARAAGALK